VAEYEVGMPTIWPRLWRIQNMPRD
jgi:hypothetical protein